MGINLTAAAPGMSRLAMALGGGGGGYQKGYEESLGLQSKIAQAMAAVQASEAAAAANRAKAKETEVETGITSGRAGVGDELLASEAGTDLPTLRAYRQQLSTGRPSMTSATGDAETDSMIGINPEPVVSSAIAQALTKLAPRYAAYRTNTKDFKPDDLAKARQLDREGDLSDSVITGALPRNTVAGAQAAAGGKAQYNSDATGAVLDLFAGSLDTSNPMAQGTIKLRGEQAGAQRANAAQSYASAGASNALRDQRRQETAQGKGGDWQYDSARGGQVNKQTGEFREVTQGGKPIGAKAAAGGGKPLPAAAAKGYLDNIQNLERANKALALIEGKDVGAANGDEAATGFKGYLPNQLLNRIDPTGVDTRAAIADLGSLVIHDRSGAAVTAAEFPRLAPFIPTEKDEPATVRKKLKMFVQNYKALVDDSSEFYRASGYNVPVLQRATAPAGKPVSAAPAAGGGGFTYLGKE